MLEIIGYISFVIGYFFKYINPIRYLEVFEVISFVIFAFILTNGIKRTKNLEIYMFRMFLFAFISQIPYILIKNGIYTWEWNLNIYENIIKGIYHYINDLNVGFLFLTALIDIYFIHKNKGNLINRVIVILLSMMLVHILDIQFGVFGLLTIFIFYAFESKKQILIYFIINLILNILLTKAIITINTQKAIYEAILQITTLLALPIIFYIKEFHKNNQKNKKISEKNLQKLKDRVDIHIRIKYLIYPIIMLIMYILKQYI